MNLKKAAAGLLIPAFMLAGCADSSVDTPAETSGNAVVQETEASENNEAKAPAPADITAAITAEIEIPSSVEKDKDTIDYYFTVDKTQLEDVSMLICGSGAFPDELVVLKMTSPEAAQTAAAAVQEHLTAQIELYRDYTPNEFYKLEGASVNCVNNYVMLFVCSNNERATEIAETFLY
ncbi:MAG: DUF4358 domain-containing protein [Oscillospiraceae bacterium]|nr:DUF4358 domain-containing protein [Oscillospiraceae bacterium]